MPLALPPVPAHVACVASRPLAAITRGATADGRRWRLRAGVAGTGEVTMNVSGRGAPTQGEFAVGRLPARAPLLYLDGGGTRSLPYTSWLLVRERVAAVRLRGVDGAVVEAASQPIAPAALRLQPRLRRLRWAVAKLPAGQRAQRMTLLDGDGSTIRSFTVPAPPVFAAPRATVACSP